MQLSARRSMRELAARFCAGSGMVHVVDPVVDLRERFGNKKQLQEMLDARGIKVDVDEISMKYERWWKAYQTYSSSLKEKRDSALKKVMLSESEGLLNALSLPNDLDSETPRTKMPFRMPFNAEKKLQHISYLRGAGMIKTDSSSSSPHTIGLPSSLQAALQHFLLQHFTESAILVSPPCMVRGAVIEGVNLCKEHYHSFTDGSNDAIPMYLSGHGLPSLMSLFVRMCLPYSTNKWPLRLVSSGATYRSPAYLRSYSKPPERALLDASQRTKIALLSLCTSKKEENAEYTRLVDDITNILNNNLRFSLRNIKLSASELFNYESGATALFYDDDTEVARVSFSGTYIPRRLNVVFKDKTEATQFVRIVYAEVDITRCVGLIVEEHLLGPQPIPETIQRLL